jgi:hypothetical protein
MTRTRFVLAGVGILVAPLTVLAASVRFAPEILPAISAPIAARRRSPSLPIAPQLSVPVAPKSKPQSSTPVPKPTPAPSPQKTTTTTPAPQTSADRQKADEDLEFLRARMK